MRSERVFARKKHLLKPEIVFHWDIDMIMCII